MKKIYLFTLVCLLLIRLDAQNLVPNPSFEDTLSCPIGQVELYKAIGWRSFLGSPDYFNECNTLSVGVPNNFAGHRTAKSGNAYAGVITYLTLLQNAREVASIKLINSLTVGQKYYVSLFVCPGTNHFNIGQANNHLGCRFTVDSFSIANPIELNNSPQIASNNVIVDTLDWTKISGSFVADSAYNYISIGTFYQDSLNSTIGIDSNTIFAYYFVDDVCVSTDSNTIVSIASLTNQIHKMRVYPNPFSDFLYFDGLNIRSYEIFDLTGRKLIKGYNEQDDEKIIIPVSKLLPGPYFLHVFCKNEHYLFKQIKTNSKHEK